VTGLRPLVKDVLFWSLPHGVRRVLVRALRPAKLRELDQVRSRFLAPYDELGCIFVHIPKTAGISIGNALFGKAPSWHLGVRTYQLVYGPEDYSRRFKFAFVRNPWARLVSAYDFLKGGGVEEHDRAWRDSHMRPDERFTDFVERWLTPSNARTEIHFLPQSEFLSVVPWSDVDVDFVGRFERLESDFAEVCRRLGVQRSLPHVNRGPARASEDYRGRYDEASARRVEEVYAGDIHRFGYRFGE